MTDDLERRIRTALHERGAALTPQHTERRGTQRTVRRWAQPLLAAAAVVVLAFAVAVAVGVGRRSGSGSDTGAPAAGGPAYAGSVWRVTSLQDRDGPLDVPPDLNATVAFTTGGSVYANDTINYLTASYNPGEHAYTVDNASSTLAGYSGGDPARERVISAVDALFFTATGAVPNGDPPQLTVVVTMRGDALTLRTAGIDVITVTLDRQGLVPVAPTGGPSDTSVAVTQAPTRMPGSASDLPYSGPASP